MRVRVHTLETARVRVPAWVPWSLEGRSRGRVGIDSGIERSFILLFGYWLLGKLTRARVPGSAVFSSYTRVHQSLLTYVNVSLYHVSNV